MARHRCRRRSRTGTRARRAGALLTEADLGASRLAVCRAPDESSRRIAHGARARAPPSRQRLQRQRGTRSRSARVVSADPGHHPSVGADIQRERELRQPSHGCR
jgi:hypothetical protein